MITFPDIRLIYSVGGNPFHHNVNLNRFVEAWQRPEVVVVHEQFWNPAAKFADIILPATTTLERNDIQAADLSRFYVAMRQVMKPFGQSRNDFDIFAELADRLGFRQEYTEGRDEMVWLRHMYDGAAMKAGKLGYSLPSFDEFWEIGIHEFPQPEKCVPYLGKFRDDPTIHPLKTPSGKIEIYSSKIASFGYDDCPGHPTWLEPAEWLGSSKVSRFPIHLLSNQPNHRLHSQLDPAGLSVNAKILNREPMRMNTPRLLAVLKTAMWSAFSTIAAHSFRR
jgi:biotin/methionine sulfoxide reductase